MARRVFFSFHYDDIWRVNQIRFSQLIKKESETNSFIDAAEFEKIKRRGANSVERWIDEQLDGTSTTVVLIGYGTADRQYVQYEIRKSYERGNALLGIWLDNIKDQQGQINFLRGANPFDRVKVPGGFFGEISIADKLCVPVYDWVNADGRNNIATWIARAPRKQG